MRHWWTGLQGVWVAPGQLPLEVPQSFNVLPHRWVVERTFAWIGRSWRKAKAYEHLKRTDEMLTYMPMLRVMLRRPTSTGGRFQQNGPASR
ncbi:transposase [Roseomonas sp. KE2513]|uniref:transposase n=1 Tax=Roseomonas sp. KE2513 TaxID=2479202 RepID=UPI0018DF5436